jgi:hypothetical protein
MGIGRFSKENIQWKDKEGLSGPIISVVYGDPSHAPGGGILLLNKSLRYSIDIFTHLLKFARLEFTVRT